MTVPQSGVATDAAEGASEADDGSGSNTQNLAGAAIQLNDEHFKETRDYGSLDAPNPDDSANLAMEAERFLAEHDFEEVELQPIEVDLQTTLDAALANAEPPPIPDFDDEDGT